MPIRNIRLLIVCILLCLCCYARTSLKDQIFQYVMRNIEADSLSPVSEQQLWEGAMTGMTDALNDHPYSSYLPYEEEIEYEQEIQGQIAGIGMIQIQKSLDSGDFFFTPLHNTPTQKAGLQFGDQIVRVNRQKVSSLSAWQFMERLRGKENTNVQLTILPRQAWLDALPKNFLNLSDEPSTIPASSSPTDDLSSLSPPADTVSNTSTSDSSTAASTSNVLATDASTVAATNGAADPVANASSTNENDTASAEASAADDSSSTDASAPLSSLPDAPALRNITLTRTMIHQEIVMGDRRDENGQWIYTLETNPTIGYIRVDQFTESTLRDFEKALEQLQEPAVQALILDFRGNPGGFLPAAVEMCDLFIEPKLDIVTTRTRNGSIRNRFVSTRRSKCRLPLAILIDQDSASSAEIVSACLQDYNRATIIGTRSYGKGTVQALVPLPCRMGLLHLTVASFWRPSGISIHRTANSPNGSWGVQPNDGCVVALSPPQKLLKDWVHALRLSFSKDEFHESLRIALIRLALLLQSKEYRNLFEPETSLQADDDSGAALFSDQSALHETETSPDGNIEGNADEDLTRRCEQRTSQLEYIRHILNVPDESVSSINRMITAITDQENTNETNGTVDPFGRYPYFDPQLDFAIDHLKNKTNTVSEATSP